MYDKISLAKELTDNAVNTIYSDFKIINGIKNERETVKKIYG